MIAVAPLVLVYQSAALALAQIRTNKLRALLTTLGILIGVAAVSAVIALIDGMHRRVVAEFESFGANKLFISPRWRESDIHRRDAWTNVVFKHDLFDDVLDRCPSVESFTRDAGYGPVPVAFGSRSTNDMDQSHFHSVDPEWHSIMRRGAEQGRPMTPIDSDRVAAVCLINEAMRDFLALDRDPSGAIVNVEYFGRMRVLGMIEPVHGLVGSPDMGEIVVPFTFSTQRFHWPTWYTVFASAKSRDVVEEAKAELDFYMRQKRRLRPGEEANFHIATSKRTLEELDDVARMMTVIAVGIVAISLLVGGVGIMNIMLVSVSERTREIGLRKAVGARPGTILLQFLVEAVVLCLVGGAIGLALGQGLTSAVAATLPSPQAMIQYDPLDNNEQEKRSGDGGGGQIWLPPAAVAVAFSFSAGVGLVFGMFPAIKAARLDPIDALRHE